LSGGQEGKLLGLFCAVVCATIVHNELHTHLNRPNSSLDWVLSHWAHFTVLRFIFCVCIILCLTVFCMHVYCVVLSHGEVDLVGLKPDPQDYYFLQCFDTVGWVI